MSPRKKYYFAYTGLFLLTAVLCFWVFVANDKSFVQDSDALHQHLNSLIYYGRWLRGIAGSFFSEGGFALSLYDFSIGYGSDVVTTMNYYAIGDPLNLLSAFVPVRYTEYLYAFLILLRMYLAGIAFSAYCAKMGLPRRSALPASLVYVFCGWALVAAMRHCYFLNPMIYLPLLCLGFEKLYRRENPLLFTGMVALSCISNFYFFYMLLFAIVAYALVRYFTNKEARKGPKAFAVLLGRSLLYGTIGVLLACVVFVPVLLLLTSTDRASTGIAREHLYSLSQYLQMPVSLMTATVESNYTILGYSAPAVISVAVLYVFPGRRVLKVAVPVLWLLLMLPDFGWLMNGLSYVTNRWAWIFSFLMAYVVASTWEDLLSLGVHRKKLAVVVGASLVYGLLSLALIFPLPGYQGAPGEVRISALCSVAVLAAAYALLLLVFWAPSKRGQARKLVSGGLVALLVVGVGANAYTKFVTADYLGIYLESGTLLNRIEQSPATDIAELQAADDSFNRFDMQKYKAKNAADIVGAHGVNFFWSLGARTASDFYTDMGMSTRTAAHSYFGLECRAPLYALASVKYYAGKEGSQPYGFVDTGKEVRGFADSKQKTVPLYENEYALPLGYTYECYFPQSEYDRLSMLDKQQAMLRGMVLPDDAAVLLEGAYPVASYESMSVVVPHQIKGSSKALVAEDGCSVTTKGKNQTVTFEFEGLPSAETYLEFEDFRFEPVVSKTVSKIDQENGHITIGIESDLLSTRMLYYSPYFRYYMGQDDFLVGLGYSEEPQHSVILSLKREATYSWSSARIVCQPMTDYANEVDALRKDVMTDEEFSTNAVSGRIALDAPKILCLSIPYSRGWSATVDGQSVELLQANTMFMAIPLDAGEHVIQLHYFTPGLKEGLLCFALGALLLVALGVGRRKTGEWL